MKSKVILETFQFLFSPPFVCFVSPLASIHGPCIIDIISHCTPHCKVSQRRCITALAMSSSNVSTLDQLKSVAEVVGAFASVAIAIIGFVWSQRDERDKAIERTRDTIRAACEETHVAFAFAFFVDREIGDGRGSLR